MSSTADSGVAAAETTMSEAEMKFLITCLTSSTGASISVDTDVVATKLDIAKKTVLNRFSKYKKDFGIVLSSGKASANGETKTPKPTPKKRTAKSAEIDRATTPSPRKKATTKMRGPKKETDVKAEVADEDAEKEEGSGDGDEEMEA